MFHRWIFLPLLALGLGCGQDARDKEDGKGGRAWRKEREAREKEDRRKNAEVNSKMVGTWRVVAAEDGGKHLKEALECRFTFESGMRRMEDGKVTLRYKSQAREGTYRAANLGEYVELHFNGQEEVLMRIISLEKGQMKLRGYSGTLLSEALGMKGGQGYELTLKAENR